MLLIKFSACYTTRNTSNKPCIFPFKLDGTIYMDCTTDDTFYNEPWCAIEVATNGAIMQWGICGDCTKDQ